MDHQNSDLKWETEKHREERKKWFNSRQNRKDRDRQKIHKSPEWAERFETKIDEIGESMHK